MSTNASKRAAAPADWQERQKLAAFYQAQLGPIQQAATASHTTAAILVTLGLAMAKFSGVTAEQGWFVLLAGVLGWLVLATVLTGGFSISAVRIRQTYLSEHAELFPNSMPYRLENFLLDFGDNFRPFLRWSTAPSPAGTGLERTGSPPIS